MQNTGGIELKGIGDGRCPSVWNHGNTRDPWSAKSMISLGGGEQMMTNSTIPCVRTPHPNTINTLLEGGELLRPRSPYHVSDSPATIRGTWGYASSLASSHPSPLERYCREVQAHEQIALGIASDNIRGGRASASRFDPLRAGSSDDGKTEAVGSHLSLTSSSTGQSTGTAPLRDPTVELNDIRALAESPNWSTLPAEEQAGYLHRMSRLKRRIRSEGSPRQSKAVRVRKRSKIGGGLVESGKES
ncbi:hypothetical protein F4778DRAFT_277294 [Xylariomycetidae sp. FL2044]|nr:hypothetical protein F4778DRAFT_277294 [Xylariomycetidae sp. FL2044]